MCVSQGNGHYFPLKSQNSESQNPLLANEDLWEESDEGSEDGSLGESVLQHSYEIITFFRKLMTHRFMLGSYHGDVGLP